MDTWPALLAVEMEAVVFGLPPALFDIEVVGEPTIIGGDGDWLLQGGCCPCAVDDFELAAKDICVWLCGVLPCCWGRFLRDEEVEEDSDGEGTWEVVVCTEFFH